MEGRGVVGMTVAALTSELLIWATVEGDLVIHTRDMPGLVMVTAAVFFARDFETRGRPGPDIVTEGGGEIDLLDAAIFLGQVEVACSVIGTDLLMER